MRETWYVTEGGEPVDPAECVRKDGALTHKSGAKIAMRFPDCPRSRSVDADAMRAKAARDLVAGADKPAGEDREMKPAGSGRTYRTRGKAE